MASSAVLYASMPHHGSRKSVCKVEDEFTYLVADHDIVSGVTENLGEHRARLAVAHLAQDVSELMAKERRVDSVLQSCSSEKLSISMKIDNYMGKKACKHVNCILMLHL